MILVACEAQATPIGSVSTPTDTPEPLSTAAAQLRYGLYANVLGYVEDIDEISNVALVEVMSAESNIGDYDIVVAYGVYDGWQESPVKQHVSLVINPNLTPLNDEGIRNTMQKLAYSFELYDTFYEPAPLPPATYRATVNETKIALANAGYPDGFVLTMAVDTIPALEAIAAQFTERNIDLHIIESNSDTLTSNRAHLLLTMWTQDSQHTAWVEQVGEQNVIGLFDLPLSYIARDGLNITFTENAWPLPAR